MAARVPPKDSETPMYAAATPSSKRRHKRSDHHPRQNADTDALPARRYIVKWMRAGNKTEFPSIDAALQRAQESQELLPLHLGKSLILQADALGLAAMPADRLVYCQRQPIVHELRPHT